MHPCLTSTWRSHLYGTNGSSMLSQVVAVFSWWALLAVRWSRLQRALLQSWLVAFGDLPGVFTCTEAGGTGAFIASLYHLHAFANCVTLQTVTMMHKTFHWRVQKASNVLQIWILHRPLQNASSTLEADPTPVMFSRRLPWLCLFSGNDLSHSHAPPICSHFPFFYPLYLCK